MTPATMLRIVNRRFSAKVFLIRVWRLLTTRRYLGSVHDMGEIVSLRHTDNRDISKLWNDRLGLAAVLISQRGRALRGHGQGEGRPPPAGVERMVGPDHLRTVGQAHPQF